MRIMTIPAMRVDTCKTSILCVIDTHHRILRGISGYKIYEYHQPWKSQQVPKISNCPSFILIKTPAIIDMTFTNTCLKNFSNWDISISDNLQESIINIFCHVIKDVTCVFGAAAVCSAVLPPGLWAARGSSGRWWRHRPSGSRSTSSSGQSSSRTLQRKNHT